MTQALAEPEETRASPVETKADRRRIKDLERELWRKDRALVRPRHFALNAAFGIVSKGTLTVGNGSNRKL